MRLSSKVLGRYFPSSLTGSGLVIAFSVVIGLATQETDSHAAEATKPPNIVIIFADDFGYADIGCYGHPTIATPRLDRMAHEGMRFTQFYSAAPVCTPSRAALLTGRYPLRSGMAGIKGRVLFVHSETGIPATERTLAEELSAAGYQTACVGKWHLGHHPPYLPTEHGFDSYFGIPYSNDMGQINGRGKPKKGTPLPLMRGTETIETEPDQRLLTERYTEEAVNFITKASENDRPFFLYLPHSMPHVPLFASERFEGTSARGLYGDVIETIDWSTGKILDTLVELGLSESTFVFFTSDNGPWLTYGLHGGSAGLLHGGKGSTWEGGMRVPGIAWGPTRIAGGQVSQEMATTMDLYTTCLSMAGVELPTDRTIDGLDLSPILFETEQQPDRLFCYYRGPELFAARWGPWKLHFKTQNGYLQREPELHDPPLLFHLDHDPSEQFNVAEDHPEVIEMIVKQVDQHRAELQPGEPQY